MDLSCYSPVHVPNLALQVGREGQEGGWRGAHRHDDRLRLRPSTPGGAQDDDWVGGDGEGEGWPNDEYPNDLKSSSQKDET